MATTITSTMLGGLRQHIVDMVDHGRYMIGGSWINSDIVTKEIQANNMVYVCFYVQASGGNSTVTQFQLLDSDDQVLAERVETLTIPEHYDALLYRFKFGVSVDQ